MKNHIHTTENYSSFVHMISVYRGDNCEEQVLKDLIIPVLLKSSCCTKQNMHQFLPPSIPHVMLDLHKIVSYLIRDFTFYYDAKVTLFHNPYQFQSAK